MRTELLTMLRETKDYVSGQKICETFGVSRTAVWKAIEQLKKEGLTIIELKEGKFSIRQHLPAGSVVDLPIKAQNAKGDKVRQINIKALREQGK